MSTRIAILSLIALALAGCRDSSGPVEVPFPTFDPEQPFPELARTTSGEKKRDKPKGQEFEDAIARELGDAGAGASEPQPETVSVQVVPLASIFLGDVPVDFDEWQHVTDGVSTIITHRKPGNMPDAMIYIEAFSPAVEDFPSYEVGRFQFTVDPGLSPNIIYPPLIALGTQWAREREAPPLDMLLALQLATTRTAGLGLGYVSTSSSFTGWKWVGKTGTQLDSELEFRLGRTSGRWASQSFPGQVKIQQLIEQLVVEVPGLDALAGQLEASKLLGTKRPPSAAWMVFGSIARRNNPNMGVHIAIVCERKPVCPVAEELSSFLSTVRVMEENALVAAPAGDYIAFARELGLNLLPVEKTISPPQMIGLLQQVLLREAAEERVGRDGVMESPLLELLPEDIKQQLGGARDTGDLLRQFPDGLPPDLLEKLPAPLREQVAREFDRAREAARTPAPTPTTPGAPTPTEPTPTEPPTPTPPAGGLPAAPAPPVEVTPGSSIPIPAPVTDDN